jgi:hypothetical protein
VVIRLLFVDGSVCASSCAEGSRLARLDWLCSEAFDVLRRERKAERSRLLLVAVVVDCLALELLDGIEADLLDRAGVRKEKPKSMSLTLRFLSVLATASKRGLPYSPSSSLPHLLPVLPATAKANIQVKVCTCEIATPKYSQRHFNSSMPEDNKPSPALSH